MKSQEQIEARLKEAREILEEWQVNLLAARGEEKDYEDYCRTIVISQRGEIKLLEWILSPHRGSLSTNEFGSANKGSDREAEHRKRSHAILPYDDTYGM